jgi:hypothetical protein
MAEPGRKSVDQTVYGLASVNLWFILLTLHVNEVNIEHAPLSWFTPAM